MAFVALVVAAPLAVVAGTLFSFLKALLSAPPADRTRSSSYLLLALGIAALAAAQVVPEWGMQTDEERDFILSALCAEGKGCPLVGNEMNQLRIKLGPLNRYLMTLCQLVTPDPRFTLAVILALHVLAAAWLAVVGDRLLGFPFGLLAGLAFGTNSVLLDVIAGASNGSWASFFQVGAVAGTLQWVRGEPRGLLIGVICLAAAFQFHGTNLVLAPPLLFAYLYWRPPTPRRTVVACGLVVAALYSSWFVYQWQTGFSNFSEVSTSWMVSEGPSLAERLARLLGPLNGLLTPFTLWGALALTTGRATPAHERQAGRLVPLFVALPLAAMLLAGGGWSSRYGAPMVAPAALATAAGLRQLAALLAGDPGRERRIGFAMTMVVLVSAAVLTLSGNWLRSRQELVSRSRAQLGLAEQIDAIRILGKHGYGASDLESRVHGPAWSRWDGGHVYIGEWLLGAASHARPGEHAVIVECKGAPREFASWQERLPTRRPLPRLLVGYQAQLAPAEVSFASRNGVFWTSRRALPFYSGMLHGGDADMRLLFDPQLGHPPEFNDLLARWPRGEPLTMRLATTLAADDEERLLVLLHDTDLRTTVTLDGRSREAIEPPVQLGEIVRHLYSVKASERASGIDIEVSIPLPAGAPEPRRVDLYEEPRCAAAPQTGS